MASPDVCMFEIQMVAPQDHDSSESGDPARCYITEDQGITDVLSHCFVGLSFMGKGPKLQKQI